MDTSPPERELLHRVVLPIASETDAAQTFEAVAPYLEQNADAVVVVHVIKKAGGAPDPASVEQMEERAEEIFEAAEEACRDRDLEMTRELAYNTKIFQGVLDVAEQKQATAIVFTPRQGSWWFRWLTGNTALNLVTESPIPVVSIPFPDDLEETDERD